MIYIGEFVCLGNERKSDRRRSSATQRLVRTADDNKYEVVDTVDMEEVYEILAEEFRERARRRSVTYDDESPPPRKQPSRMRRLFRCCSW
ncbi:hypothetical protein AAVH_29396 [Aphelenchoides avenae]|nr:hypothetical protein AAVH_29396 [Aphelenchus avenae]